MLGSANQTYSGSAVQAGVPNDIESNETPGAKDMMNGRPDRQTEV